MTRRDGTSASDEIGIYIDSYGDRRSGFEFYVNAAGVKRDVAISSDVNEDVSWNAVWDAVARIDSAGWSADFRIPFSQLRFPAGRHEFGFLVNRVIQRRAENLSWPAYHPSRTGIVSQFGVLSGLSGIGGTHDVEITPYVKAQSHGTRGMAAGGDLRLGLGSGFAVNATVLPDFGQVEADPSVVNLTSVEAFYPEQRPFFLEGASTYQTSFNCNIVNCANEGLFYSRRIGRAPQLADVYGNGGYDAAPILGAAKLAGRTTDGFTVGALVSSTGQVSSANGRTIEPATTYGVARMQHDFRDGQSGVSGIFTVVDRSLDEWSTPYLARTATVAGGTLRHRFFDNQYEVWGSATQSRTAGSAPAIALLQENPVHYLRRPGNATRFDSTRTTLSGDQEELAVGKYGGLFEFETSYERQSAGYDANDLGYLQRADEQTVSVWAALVTHTPRAFYRSLRWNINQWDTWNAAGERLDVAANMNAHANLTNNWWLSAGATLSHIGSTDCDHCARGGPSLRSDEQLSPWLSIQGDTRNAIVPNFDGNWSVTDGGRSRSATINPTLDLRVSSRSQATVAVLAGSNHDNTQWFGNFADSNGTHFSFAHVDQSTRSVTLRMNYAATPNLSFQVYAAPFVSDGRYFDVRALSATPLAASYADRFVPFTPPPATPMQFAVRQLRATTVVRWELAPGSALFLVWTHDRDGSDISPTDSWGTSARELFSIRPVNTLLLKMSYWLAR